MKKPCKPKRRVRFQVVPGGWRVLRDGKEIAHKTLQETAIAIARVMARKEHKRGTPTQLLIAGKRGKIRSEATYGGDKYPPKG